MSTQLRKRERLIFIYMLMCFPVLKSRENMNFGKNFEFKRQSCKG